MNALKTLLIIIFLFSTLLLGQNKKNILFLMADDFNHWITEIGYNAQALTPNLDKLAANGVLFTDAQCSSPVCNPSRNAIFSGYRPSTTGIMSHGDPYIREVSGF